MKNKLIKFFSKRRIIWLSAIVVLLLGLYIFRHGLLGIMGNHLIDEDELVHADAIFVLGGNSIDRAEEASKLWSHGWADKVICTGGNVPNVLRVLDTMITESELCAKELYKNGVDSSTVISIPRSTSTMEEAYLITDYCKKKNIDTIIVVSDKFHTNRIQHVLNETVRKQNIVAIVHGCNSSVYSESRWWYSEEGMIMVNNEYIKLLYYMWKY